MRCYKTSSVSNQITSVSNLGFQTKETKVVQVVYISFLWDLSEKYMFYTGILYSVENLVGEKE